MTAKLEAEIRKWSNIHKTGWTGMIVAMLLKALDYERSKRWN